MFGADRCTCWEPVYDLEQAPLIIGAPQTRTTCCHDCAYRNDSPERAAGQTDWLVDIASSSTFACHQGMRRMIVEEHPDGRRRTIESDDYHPPIKDGVAYRADGTPADLCAGWNAHRRALLTRMPVEDLNA